LDLSDLSPQSRSHQSGQLRPHLLLRSGQSPQIPLLRSGQSLLHLPVCRVFLLTLVRLSLLSVQ